MTEPGRSSFVAPPLRRTAEAARADEPKGDDARARDTQLVIEGVYTDRDDASLAGHAEESRMAPEWA